MAAKAYIWNGYRWRLAAMAGLLLFLGGWFLYDGAIGYPNKNIERLAFDDIANPESENYIPNYKEKWVEIAEENGWSTTEPGKPYSTYEEAGIFSDVTMQFIYAIPCLFFGGWVGLNYLRSFGRWIETDDEGIKTSWGAETQFGDITRLDKRKWKKKGIVYVYYTKPGSKTEASITLDDWKFDREPTGEMLEEIEEITGLGAEADADAAEVEAQYEAEVEADETEKVESV